MDRILVATDLMATSRNARAGASRIASRHRAELGILHVGPRLMRTRDVEAARARIRSEPCNIRGSSDDADSIVSIHIRDGTPHETIPDFVTGVCRDMWARLLRGSFAKDCVLGSSTDMLLVPKAA
ncbi:MAG TPA: universal stress protein [Allosphingosinicella sp.]|nr:universal stress protein [Allosphingosinicella sp.]